MALWVLEFNPNAKYVSQQENLHNAGCFCCWLNVQTTSDLYSISFFMAKNESQGRCVS